MIGSFASVACAIITLGMAVLQLSLTFGSPLGEFVLGGQFKVLPPKMRLISSTLSLIFFFVGMAYLQSGNVIYIGLSSEVLNIVIIANMLFLVGAIINNGLITKSKKEKYVMTPISILSLLLSSITFFFI